VPKVRGALAWAELDEQLADCLPKRVGGLGGCATQEPLELAEHELDRVFMMTLYAGFLCSRLGAAARSWL
jgi:hypothetical protein